MPDVFLSYSSKDRAAAQRVQQALEARGIDVFWDQETPGGQDWDTWIRSKLTACKIAVVLWSHTSVASDNVRHEALVARKAKKLLPAMIDQIAAEDLPMGLYMVQTINLTDWRNTNSTGLTRLADEIDAQLGRQTGGSVVKAAPPRPGPSPRLQTTLALVAIAAVVGGVAWFMMQQQPIAEPGAAPGDAAATACANGGLPIPGVCPETSGGASAPGTLSTRIVGHWFWEGIACADGPDVTRENAQLIFTTLAERYVHAIEQEDGLRLTTRVAECSGCAPEEIGDTYSFSPEFVATPAERNFNLVVQNIASGTRDTWAPCEVLDNRLPGIPLQETPLAP